MQTAVSKEVTLEEIADLAYKLISNIKRAIDEVEGINEEIHLLAVNALIEAARAGESGKTFGVVASYMSELNGKVEKILKGIKDEMDIQSLSTAIMEQSLIVKGNRLADIALTNIDIVDRSLYERASDVVWWAHDTYAIEALKNRSAENIRMLEKRLAIILDAYTVYYDIVVCDVEGNIIASGKNPRIKGRNCKGSDWFDSAFKGRFGCSRVHNSPIAEDRSVIIFSSVIKDESGSPLGVLADIFRWKEFADKIVRSIPLSDKEKSITRACITDSDGVVIADSANRYDIIELSRKKELFSMSRGFIIDEFRGKRCIIAHAYSQGYENYSSGFHSLLIQEVR